MQPDWQCASGQYVEVRHHSEIVRTAMVEDITKNNPILWTSRVKQMSGPRSLDGTYPSTRYWGFCHILPRSPSLYRVTCCLDGSGAPLNSNVRCGALPGYPSARPQRCAGPPI